MAKYQNPRNLPDEHMRLVGIIADHWQCIDLYMQQVVAEAMNLDFPSVCVLIEHTTFEFRMNIIQALGKPIREENRPLWDELTAVLNDVRSANDLRNKYVHALWGVEDDQPLPVRFTVQVRKGKIINDAAPTSAIELAEAASQIWKAAERFNGFFTGLGMLRLP